MEYITNRFSFLTRDIEAKKYIPVAEDGYVFNSEASIGKFKSEALALLKLITDRWKELGGKTVIDPDRKVEIPDESSSLDILQQVATGKISKATYDEMAFLLSNADIAKKSCIVRGIVPGWWLASYAGKYSGHVSKFVPAIRILVRAMHHLKSSSPYFKKVFGEVMFEAGDPLDTNSGFPLYESIYTKEGMPVSKMKSVELFPNLHGGTKKWSDIIDRVKKRMAGNELAKFPFASAPIRRLQPGYKWLHTYQRTSHGIITRDDVRGNNSIRVAWMGSYLFNLLLSPIQYEWKALRKCLPGMFHDGATRKSRLEKLKGCFLMEGDYSNYDRFMPIDIFKEFVKQYVSNLSTSGYWNDILTFTHEGSSIIVPDPNGDKPAGWAVTPQRLGLLSGLKITSEEGSIINGIICIQSVLDSKIMNEAQMYSYLTSMSSNGTLPAQEYFLVQSDDTLLIHKDPNTLSTLAKAFKANADAAGIKGSLSIGNRFLMRHLDEGADLPVPMRVWQNTLSNENPPMDPLIFLVGLCMRTDGLLGGKTYDPFGNGKSKKMNYSQMIVTLRVLESLHSFASTAAVKVTPGINFLADMITIAKRMMTRFSADKSGFVEMDTSDLRRLSIVRQSALKLLAENETSKLRNDALSMQSWIYSLHKDRNVPSSEILLDLAEASDPIIAMLLKKVKARENEFFKLAVKKLKIPLTTDW